MFSLENLLRKLRVTGQNFTLSDSGKIENYQKLIALEFNKKKTAALVNALLI